MQVLLTYCYCSRLHCTDTIIHRLDQLITLHFIRSGKENPTATEKNLPKFHNSRLPRVLHHKYQTLYTDCIFLGFVEVFLRDFSSSPEYLCVLDILDDILVSAQLKRVCAVS